MSWGPLSCVSTNRSCISPAHVAGRKDVPSGPLHDEWARLDAEANAILTEAEWAAVLEEATFPKEVLDVPDEDHVRMRDEMEEEGLPIFHERVLIESLRRRIAAKKKEG